MDFGKAIEALKEGKRVTRGNWNRKNMHIYLEDSLHCISGIVRGNGPKRIYEPCIVMFTASGKHQPGWLASQADILADDWQEVVG